MSFSRVLTERHGSGFWFLGKMAPTVPVPLPASGKRLFRFPVRFLGHPLRPERPLTGLSGPSGPKIAKKKVSKKSPFGGLQKKSPKIPEKIKKYTQKSNFRFFFFYFFVCFRGLFCRPTTRLFLRLFCDFGPGGPGDSCKWSLGSQAIL